MPQTFNLVDQSVFQVPEEIAELEIKMWGAGGGGESVADDLTKTAGDDGGDSEFFGLKATGGAGGSQPGGGTGGSGSSVFDWASVGVSVSAFSGNNGGIPDKGNGASIGNTRYGNGGGGDPGELVYQSSVSHQFNNETNRHTFTQSSPDLSVTYEGQYAVDGLSCSPNYGTKHYRISFNAPFTNSNYTLTLNSVTQRAAGGGSNTPYYSCGTLGKTSSGFRIWFGNGNGKNTYVMGFVFTCTGLKAGGQGMGGGGGGAVTAAFTRQDLIDSITYAPGTTHTATVGTKGVGYANEGGNGYLEVSMIIRPKVILEVLETVLIIGQCTTLSWETTGDADTFSWLAGNISNTLLTSSVEICPQITTTYTAQASGIGGTSAPVGVTVYVVYVPTATLTVPDPIDYGDALFVDFETQYADLEIRLEPFFRMTDGTTVVGDIIQITPAVTGESGRPDSDTVVNSPTGGVEIPVPWGTVGPELIDVKLTVIGTGGSFIDFKTLQVNIDRTPDNVIIPETDGKFKDEEPVYTPETDILTDLILIEGIDIPVTVKSNEQIKIDINQEDNWLDVEEI